MSKERMMILDMLGNGKITPADAETLLRALGEPVPAGDFAGEPEPGSVEPLNQGDMGFPPEFDAHVHHPHPGFEDELPPLPPLPPVPSILPNPPLPENEFLHGFSRHGRRRRYPDPSYAVAMKRAGVDLSPEQMLRLQEEDIEPEQVAALLAVRRQEWSIDDLVKMLTHEVSPELVLKLHDLGLGSISADEIVALAEHDVDPEYLERARELKLPGLSVRDLIAFSEHDVDLETAQALLERGPVSPREIIKAADHDVSASFVRRMAGLLPGVDTRQLIELNNHDVSPRFVEALHTAGFTDLSAKQVINLQNHDFDPADAGWFREKLGAALTLEDLMRFAAHDIDRDYLEELLAFNIPGLDKDTLVEMAIHDVSPEDIELAREAYGDGITTADLIEMAKSR